MSEYRTFKTTMGRKYKVRMTDDEIVERDLYRLSVVVLPFIGTVALMAVWLWRG